MLLRNIWKDHKILIKYSTLAFVGSSVGWFYYQVKHTRHILENAFDTSVIRTMDHCVLKEDTFEEETLEIESILDRKSGFFQWTVDSLKFAYVRRLLSVAKDCNKYYRTKALNKLAKLKNLDNWHYALVANMIDPQSAVTLARTRNVDKRLFPEPPYRYHNYNKDQLINLMREFLMELYEKSEHPCIGYFLSKVFVFEHDCAHIVDHDSSALELSKFIQSEKEVLPMCLESLLHHCSIEKYSADIANMNGLPLLMEIYKRYPDDLSVTMKLCQILSYTSLNKQLLELFHISGWIGVLSEWCSHEDIHVSIPAARALANLDEDSSAQYSSNLYVLHPVNRTKQSQDIDVVFVHGLLGGVFFTWRQRTKDDVTIGLIETLSPDVDKQKPTKRKSAKEFIRDFTDKIIGEDYEVVWNDLPSNANEDCDGPFTCPLEKYDCDNFTDNYDFTYCWPKDWLGKDCKNIRIIGVNYDTNLSMWTPLCPTEKEKFTLNERSDIMSQMLLKCDIGKRPIVWVTHSMGGLIVKNILCKAYESDNKDLRNICLNTKGVVFYSTPHYGSKLANLSNAVSLVLWPSVEVQELRENCPKLQQIHDRFLKIAEEIPMKVITFVETKSTVVSAMKFNFLLVERNSGNPGIGEYFEIPLDHLGICKPENRFSFLYQKVLHLLKEVKEDISEEDQFSLFSFLW
ncbi:protein SERAC1 isoform X2 [Sitophilus oryzae]|uniref:Protein SERAC1 n=1 Tax=Sitophilus oryzae TaxID=7048 RepID=A0A6J2XPP7_SITOR|nr:protein SERAC1 isoform X2 [Sitophilus oryzae]